MFHLQDIVIQHRNRPFSQREREREERRLDVVRKELNRGCLEVGNRKSVVVLEGWRGLERDSEALAKSEKSEYVTTNEWTLQ